MSGTFAKVTRKVRHCTNGHLKPWEENGAVSAIFQLEPSSGNETSVQGGFRATCESPCGIGIRTSLVDQEYVLIALLWTGPPGTLWVCGRFLDIRKSPIGGSCLYE